MKDRNLGLYAVALAIAVVGALWAGLPASTLLVLAVVLTCPLMMFFMMRGMHDGDGHDPHAIQRPHDDGEHNLPQQPDDHRRYDSVR